MKPSDNSHSGGRARAALAIFILALLLPNLVWFFVGHRSDNYVSATIVSIALLALFFAMFGTRLWIACALLALMVVLMPVEVFYLLRYGQPSTASIVATVFASNPREVIEFLGSSAWLLVVSVPAATAFALFTIVKVYQADLRWRHRLRDWILLFAFLAPIITVAIAAATTGKGALQQMMRHAQMAANDGIEPGYPFGPLLRFAQYGHHRMELHRNAMQLRTFSFHARAGSTAPRRQIYVFVLGESSQKARWQMFGYERPTTPELLAKTHLIPITDMLTPWPDSLDAIPQVLTRRPISDNESSWPEPSFIKAMQEAGYETYWLSNQLPIGEFDSPVSNYANEAQHVRFVNYASWSSPGGYDDALLQPLRDAISGSDSDEFIVLHTMGSHASYDSRYPPSATRFGPTISDQKSNSPLFDRFGNSYDNSVVYTDHFLVEVIAYLEHTNAITALWYESDHGELLPSTKCPLGGHGQGTRSEFEIPALFWYSDAYESTYPARVAALTSNAGKKTMSADTFESLVDMANVTFPGHDESRSLFSPAWSYRPRLVSFRGTTDYDKAAVTEPCGLVVAPLP